MDFPKPKLHEQHVLEGKRLALQLTVDWLADAIDDPTVVPSPMWACGRSIQSIKEDRPNISNLLRKAVPILDTHFPKYKRE